MGQAALLLASAVATLRSSFSSLLNNGVAVYPDTQLAEVKCHPAQSKELLKAAIIHI